MKNLKVWQKLALMGVVFMIPFAVVTWRLITSVNTLGVDFARKEIDGAEYSVPVFTLLQELQLRRGFAYAALSGDAAAKDRVVAKSADVDKAIQAIDAVDRKLGAGLKTGTDWPALKKAVGDLLAQPTAATAKDSFAQHTKVIDATIAFIVTISDLSNLTLDPDLDTYYLMDLSMFKAPALAEFFGQARDLGQTPAEQRARLTELTSIIDYVATQTDTSLGKALAQNAALQTTLGQPRTASQTAMREGLELHRRTLTQPDAAAKPADTFAEMTKRIDVIFDTNRRVATELIALINVRIAKLQRGVLVTLGFAALGLLLVSAVGLYIMRDITRPLGHLVATAHRIAAGDLTADPASTASRKDELGTLARAFERMGDSLREMAGVANQIAAGDIAVSVKPQSERDAMGNALAAMGSKLSTLIGQVQRSGIAVNTSVNEISATAKQQQATANEIAATTTEIGATSKEITATSKELVRTVNEVSAVAESTAALANSGQTGISKMEETMRHVMDAGASINAKLAVLNEKAGNINQVVTTITKVADQTNLLSLNAAIEAEKAGEYGRGFAVVATEIRRLADQTAVATYDIEQMVKEIQSAVSAGVMGMDKFSEEVRRGVTEVQQVAGQLGQIIHQVQALTPRFETVNEGMQAQATGAEQISDALAQLGEAARQTADSLRQSSSAIEQLNGASQGLKTSVEKFRVS